MAESAGIPVIDIASGRPEAEVARELVDAAVEFGFIYVKSGGMDVKAIERAFELVSLPCPWFFCVGSWSTFFAWACFWGAAVLDCP